MKKNNVFAIILTAMLVTACGSASPTEMAAFSVDTSSASSSRGIAATAEYDYAEAAEEAAADYDSSADLDSGYLIDDAAAGGDTDSSSGNEIAEVDTSKKIVYNLTYSVETTDLDALDAAIQAKVTALGGYVEYMSADGNSYDDSYGDSNRTSRRYAYYTVRIPVAHLDEFAESVEEGANVTSRSKSTQDITSSYIDTDSRRKSLEEELATLDDMAKKATTVDELIQIEAQRTEVRADLENIASQLKSMDERVNYSTVDINVTEVTVLTDTTAKDLSWQERIANGFTTSCENLIETSQEILIWIASNLPMILFWIVILIIALVLLRLVLILAGTILGVHHKRKTRKNKTVETKTVAEAAPADKRTANKEPAGKEPADKAPTTQTPKTDEKD